MLDRSSINFHVEYMDVGKHFCPYSEKFSGADALLTALYAGWIPDATIYQETRWFGGMRHITVYHFRLTRDDVTMTMPVINNPFVDKFVLQPTLHLEPLENQA